MKRSAIARKPPERRPERQWTGPTPGMEPRRATMASQAQHQAAPKDNPAQDARYMAAVRRTACKRCGWYREGEMQFCHADILGRGGKGKGLKSDCRLGWSGCQDCHWHVGTSGRMSKIERHAFEADAGHRQRAEIVGSGAWPAGLEQWKP